MMRSLLAGLLVTFVGLGGLRAQDAEQIMERARIAAALQHNDLTGSLWKRGGPKAAVGLFLKGKNIQFQYSTGGQPWQIFHMRLARDQYDLFEIVGGKTIAFPKDKLVQPVAGTDLTFEDLSLRFLYWPKPVLQGVEKVKGEDCWKIRVNNPGKDGNYRSVYVWVHQKAGAFMRIRGHDAKGDLRKEFQVENIMRLKDGTYTLRKMKVAALAGGRTTGLSYLEFEKPERRKPGGLR